MPVGHIRKLIGCGPGKGEQLLNRILKYVFGTVEAELVSADPAAALTYYSAQGLRLQDPELTAGGGCRHASGCAVRTEPGVVRGGGG